MCIEYWRNIFGDAYANKIKQLVIAKFENRKGKK